MDFTHFSVKEFLSSPLRLKLSRISHDAKQVGARGQKGRSRSSQQQGLGPECCQTSTKELVPPAQVGPPTCRIRKPLGHGDTSRDTYSEYNVGRDGGIEFPNGWRCKTLDERSWRKRENGEMGQSVAPLTADKTLRGQETHLDPRQLP